MNKWVDFKQVKEVVSMEMVLNHYGIKLRRINEDSLRGHCPLPCHTSDKSKESFGANLSKNIWACQSISCVEARGGHKGGNVLDFAALMEGSCSIREAALKLQEWFGADTTPGKEKETAPASEEKEKLAAIKNDPQPVPVGEGNRDTAVNLPLKFKLKDISASHRYLTARGISKETANIFGVGFFQGKGSMAGRVVIPINNEKGELIAYAGRAIDEAEPKYRLPVGFRKSLVLYNLDRALKSGQEGCQTIVVEGFFDTMKVHQAGFRGVVGLMGCILSEAQENLLVENFDRIILLLDGDDAGRAATEDCLRRLARQMFVKAIMLPDGKQPDMLSPEELKGVLEN
jgi:DNA primase